MLTTTVAGRTWHFSHAIGRKGMGVSAFSEPISVAVAPEGILYVLSRGEEAFGEGIGDTDKRISKLTIDEEFLGDFGHAEFTWPSTLAVDKEGNIYCSDEHHNFVAFYTPDGKRLGQWGDSGSKEGQLNGPAGLAFDQQDNLYVVNSRNHQVQKFTKDGRFLMGWGSEGEAESQFNLPWGITSDQSGDVYVVDWGNNRVQKFSQEGEFLLSFGSYEEEDGGELNHPAGVAVDSEGDVYITDWGNKRVQIYDSKGSIITALWGDDIQFSKWGKEYVESDPEIVKAYRRVKDLTPLGRFQRPVGIAVDEQDRIIISEPTRCRLQVYAKEKDYAEPQYNL